MNGPSPRPRTLRECSILGVGAYRPRHVAENNEIARLCGVTDEWIITRTGIRTRSVAGPEDTLEAMAASAASEACAHGRVDPADLDCLLLATLTNLRQVPPAAPALAHALGARHAMAVDLVNACSGFCYALAVARDLVRAGTAGLVLVAGAERMSDVVDPADRNTAPIFGDGAGAVVVGSADAAGIGPVVWGSDGTGRGAVAMSAPWNVMASNPPVRRPYLEMDGAAIWRWVRSDVAPAARKAISVAGITPDELAAFVPHQANARVIDMLVRQIDLPEHVVVAKDVELAGNTSAATVPLAMYALLEKGQVRSGQYALLAGFGAGLAHAAQVVRLP